VQREVSFGLPIEYEHESDDEDDFRELAHRWGAV